MTWIKYCNLDVNRRFKNHLKFTTEYDFETVEQFFSVLNMNSLFLAKNRQNYKNQSQVCKKRIISTEISKDYGVFTLSFLLQLRNKHFYFQLCVKRLNFFFTLWTELFEIFALRSNDHETALFSSNGKQPFRFRS